LLGRVGPLQQLGDVVTDKPLGVRILNMQGERAGERLRASVMGLREKPSPLKRMEEFEAGFGGTEMSVEIENGVRRVVLDGEVLDERVEPLARLTSAASVDVGGWVLDAATAASVGLELSRLLAPIALVGEEPQDVLARLLDERRGSKP
jgi:hypothetical protein